MWDHRASLTRRWIENLPGSQGTWWSPLKENNYGCKRRYCSGSRSIVPTFCWCWGRCIFVTAGESAGYQLVAGGTRRSLNTGKLPRYPYNPHAFPPFKSLLLGVWLVATPHPHLQSSYPHRVGGRTGLCLLMVVFPQSRLYSHVFQCHLEYSPILHMLRKFWRRQKNTNIKHNLELIFLMSWIMKSVD